MENIEKVFMEDEKIQEGLFKVAYDNKNNLVNKFKILLILCMHKDIILYYLNLPLILFLELSNVIWK